MRTVQLPGIPIACSAIGFGCANLMGRISLKQSARALDCAYDRGVTFFDTSRSYGWGRSEEVLGRFIKGKRDKVVVCTKFGTLPPPYSRWREAAKPIVRGALTFARKLGLAGLSRRIVGKVADHSSSVVRRGQFDPKSAAASLETSLKELGTDTIDILLLHNPDLSDVADGTTFEFLRDQVKKGSIRTYGISSSGESVRAICHRFPDIPSVQVPNNLFEDNLRELGGRDAKSVLTNVPFGSGAALVRVRERAESDPDLAARCRAELGLDIRTVEGAASFCLRVALAANPTGVVICGMHDPRRIDANVADANATGFSNLDRLIESFRRSPANSDRKS